MFQSPQIQDRIVQILKIIPQDRVQQRTEVQTVDIPVPHTGSMLPTTLWGKSPCEVAASVIRRLQNSSSWTDSEAECRFSVCLACSYRRCGESPRAKLQRLPSEDFRTPVCGQAVKQSAEMRSVLEFLATTQSCCERSLESVNRVTEFGTFPLLAPNAHIARSIVPSSLREGDCS